MNLKAQLYAQCLEKLTSKKNALAEEVASLQESLSSETKNTAGDKHETGRAMLQLEMEKTGQQLQEAEQTLATFLKIDPRFNSETARIGSIVETLHQCYYLSVSLGKIDLENRSYFVISPQSPIGKNILGKQQGDSFEFQGAQHKIIKVY